MLADTLNQMESNHLLCVLPLFFLTLKLQHVHPNHPTDYISFLHDFLLFPSISRDLCFERAALGDPFEEVEALGEEEL